ncbi:MAG TPA: hypothetical protein PLQ13_09085 [Candidatus Krumholzibacteria bacterium]|nr:hypothetical protein [Candidatus Krumholzibacteria bacterium]
MTARPSTLRLALALPLLLLVAACSSEKIVFVYPDEAMDFRYQEGEPPSVYFDGVTDMRPPVQREGEGHFFGITYPKDASWDAPASIVYAEALAQDLQQTNLVALVPLRGQARYVLTADLISMTCRLERSPMSFLLTGAVGAGVGMAVGEDASHRAKLASALAVVGMLAIPVPTSNRAECEVRLVLKDMSGDILWESSCLGEYEAKKAVTPTARQDQQLVDEHLTRAVKRANACLLGQLRQYLVEHPAPGS